MVQMSRDLDEVIRSTYEGFPGTVDDIVCDPVEATRFATAVEGSVSVSIETKVVLRRLMTLRKRGNKEGGLPRKCS